MKKSEGYTLVELMVTVAIFSLTFIVIGAIFLAFTTAQSRASTAQRLLNEGNFLFETVVREARMNAIDYDCGLDYATDHDQICLRSIEDGDAIRFRVTGGPGALVIEVCRDVGGIPCTWINITPTFLKVNAFEFYVYPVSNPLGSVVNADAFHPMTFIKMTLEAGRGRSQQVFELQTAVSSRAYTY